jgi:enoyl-CoA hydratase/carnithine racemase
LSQRHPIHHRVHTAILTLGLSDFVDRISSPAAWSSLRSAGGVPIVAVDLGSPSPCFEPPVRAGTIRALPTLVVGLTNQRPTELEAGLVDLFDVVCADPGAVAATVEEHPLASVTLALVLRATVRLDVPAALAVESAAYSTLQAGPEFARWRAAHPSQPAEHDDGPVVLVVREGGSLRITLNRPAKHNALNTAMRDQLHEALLVAAADHTIDKVILDGAGPSFCSGGDLDEFGSLPDPATAHLIRLSQSSGVLLSALGTTVEARLHGACMGAGIELPALASKVVAHPESVIALPEVSMGLIPGAGGTVSLPRRIGRHRSAELALTGMRLDARTALAWGLVDQITEAAPRSK